MARILIIDDDPDVLRVLHNLFLAMGYSVEDAPDSATGIQKHRAKPFDLVLTDIVMPDKEGISTIIELRHEYPDLKIVAMSGGGDFEPYGYLDIARRVGADRTITKPFSVKEILNVMNELLMPVKPDQGGTES